MSGNNSSSSVDLSMHQYKVGDRVQVYWKDDLTWYPGTLTKEKRRREATLVYIEYDDGEEEWLNVHCHKIRPFKHKPEGLESTSAGKKNKTSLEPQQPTRKPKKNRSDNRFYEDNSGSEGDTRKQVSIGDRVEVWWAWERSFFSGTVTRQKGNKHYIEYDDGDTEWKDLSRYMFRFLKTKRSKKNKKRGELGKRVSKSSSSSSHALVDSDDERKDPTPTTGVVQQVEKRKRGRPRKHPKNDEETKEEENEQRPKKLKVEVEPDVASSPTPKQEDEDEENELGDDDDNKMGIVENGRVLLGRDDTVPIGSRVEVSCWSETYEKEWFGGTVTKRSGRKYYVEYDDDETDWIVFHRQEVRLVLPGAGDRCESVEEVSQADEEEERQKEAGRDHNDDAMDAEKNENQDHSNILLGSLVEIWNSVEKAFFAGVVKRRKKGQPGVFVVKYDNGEKDLVDFRTQRYRLLSSNTEVDESKKPKAVTPKRAASPSTPTTANTTHASRSNGSNDVVLMTKEAPSSGKSKPEEGFGDHPTSPDAMATAKDLVSFSENSDNGDGADDGGTGSKTGSVAIGSRVEIWWTLDKQYFPGTVTKKDGLKYFVDYDSGENGWVDSSQADVRLLEGGVRGDGVPANITMKLEESCCDEMDTSGHETTTKNPPMLEEETGKDQTDQKARPLPAVGARVEVWSSARQQFCPGEVIRTGSRRFLVEYDHNGGRGWVSMRQEQKFRCLSSGDVFEDELSDEDDEDNEEEDDEGPPTTVGLKSLRKTEVARKVSEPVNSAAVMGPPVLQVEIKTKRNAGEAETDFVAQDVAAKGKKKKAKKSSHSKTNSMPATIIDSHSSDDEKHHRSTSRQDRRKIKLKTKGRQ